MGSLNDLTPEILRHLYENENLTEIQIAERFGCYQVKVGRLRRQWGIPTRTKGQRATATLPPLTSQQRQLLIGSLLGDGSMDATSGESARYNEGHCIDQSSYLEWKINILGPYVSLQQDNSDIEGLIERIGALVHDHG